MPGSVFWWFFGVDTVLGVGIILAFYWDDSRFVYRPPIHVPILASIVTRTPVTLTILAATFVLVRRMASLARTIDPFVWYASGIAIGYFFFIAVFDLLTPDTLQIMGPYVAAFVVSSGVYLAGRMDAGHRSVTT